MRARNRGVSRRRRAKERKLRSGRSGLFRNSRNLHGPHFRFPFQGPPTPLPLTWNNVSTAGDVAAGMMPFSNNGQIAVHFQDHHGGTFQTIIQAKSSVDAFFQTQLYLLRCSSARTMAAETHDGQTKMTLHFCAVYAIDRHRSRRQTTYLTIATIKTGKNDGAMWSPRDCKEVGQDKVDGQRECAHGDKSTKELGKPSLMAQHTANN
ncbi:uncharacterized protein J3D65DRAFT_659562 [Phyllosticta citribraziliensis]|uniref:Uncharacterized protein n=1 Tax=Phyllosticta citribraziliensis TaxID=989973 RepID=A0ABR1LMP0_9PEZI